VVTDVSPIQLKLNGEKVAEAGLSGAVENRLLLDVVNMDTLADDTFDAVVCYGGPLSYAMNRRDEGLRECVRVTRPSGPLLISVMCLWGSVHKGLSGVLSVPKASNDAIISSGDVTSEALPGHRHWCHAFRGIEFKAFLLEAGLSIEALSAATCLSTGWSDRLSEIRANEDRWGELLEMEIAACAEPGCVEAGPHIIAVALKPNTD
jgi:SAM-dependent methyltransferase